MLAGRSGGVAATSLETPYTDRSDGSPRCGSCQSRLMRNILDDKPTRDLHGGPAYARSLVDVGDCLDRTILDIGCGFGWFELIALDRGARAIAAIEPTEDDLVTAREHIDDERVDFRVASALELPFEHASFDTVVCWEVLEHLPPVRSHKPLTRSLAFSPPVASCISPRRTQTFARESPTLRGG